MSITVVLCNYMRPENVKKIINVIKNYKLVKEIIVTHGNKETYEDFDSAINIKNYKINSKYGGAQRFFAALNSKNKCILFIDDDLYPTENYVNKLYNEYIKNTDNIYGPFPRNCDSSGYYLSRYYTFYIPELYFSILENGFNSRQYNTILTPVLMVSNNNIKGYINNFSKYSKFLQNSKGNGEDLSLNNYIIKKGQNPQLVYAHFWEINRLPSPHAYSSKSDHGETRNNFCKEYN